MERDFEVKKTIPKGGETYSSAISLVNLSEILLIK
jgi:hypothetical protein